METALDPAHYSRARSPLAQSDRQARFEAFVATHHARAVRMAFRLVGDDEEAAEDVAQEAFLRAHRGLSRFRDEAELSTWFYRILVRQASNYRRRMGVRRKVMSVFGFGESSRDQPSDPMLRDQIAAALEHLSDKQRTVFILVHLEQMTVNDAAAAMDCAPGTAKSHLHRALKSLRATLSEHHHD